MTASSSVTRWPENGQFWVWKNPLSLLQLKSVGQLEGGDPGCIVCVRWTPFTDEEEFIVHHLAPENSEYLWWNLIHPPPRNWSRVKSLMVGDVLIQQDGRLLFLGPETTPTCLHVLASWQVCERHLMGDVYQYGAGHREVKPKTSFERVLEGGL